LRFRVDFLARPAAKLETPGHAWVCIYRGPEVGPAVRDCFGFYPKNLADVLLGLVTVDYYPAVVRTDDGSANQMKSATVGFAGSITKAQYDAVAAVVKSWRERGYSLAWQNCTDFVDAVALAVGLTTPPSAAPRYPPTYVAKLGGLNPKRLSSIKPAP
jgi:hypothetical protein